MSRSSPVWWLELAVMASRFMRSWAIGVCMAALLAASAPEIGHAQGARATIEGSEQPNFGRIILTLPGIQTTSVRVAGSVLIVGFSEPVALQQVERIVRQMPSYISVARIDPDGLGARFALKRTVTPNKIEAAERVFIDLIPPGWQGMLPGLPTEVVVDLARRAQAAEAMVRSGVRIGPEQEAREVDVRVARLPTLTRLVFDLPPDIPVEPNVVDNTITLNMRGPVKLDPARLRPLLPESVTLAGVENESGGLTVKLEAAEGHAIRHFREEDGFTVDFALPPRAAPSPVAAPAPAAAAPPAPQGAPQIPAQADAAKASGPAELAPVLPQAQERAAQPALPPQKVGITASTVPDGKRVDFLFPRRTAAAAFQDRGETVIVFDTIDEVDPQGVAAAAPGFVQEARGAREGRAMVLRLKFKSAGVMRFAPDGLGWALTVGDAGVAAATVLRPQRGFDESGQSVLSVPISGVSAIHWIGAEEGGQLAVATSVGPGAAMPKPQRFVELQIEQSMQGVVVRPVADDITVRSNVSHVTIARGGGLALSVETALQPAAAADPTQTGLVIERSEWEKMRLGSPREQMAELVRAAATAQRSERAGARIALAAHLLANGLGVEALGPLDALVAEEPARRSDRRVRLMQGMAHTMMHRPKEAEAALAADSLKESLEADLWRAVNDSRAGRYSRAFAAFRRASAILDGYPDHLQAMIRPEALRTAIAMKDQAVAGRHLGLLNEYVPMWLNRDQVALMQAEFDEMAGRVEAALTGYRALFDSAVRPVAARAQLKGMQLANRENDNSIPREEMVARLETLTIAWRGDQTEIEALGELGNIYVEDQRWRDAFGLARKATAMFPDHAITRRLHDEAAKHFDELFTSGKGATLGRSEVVALFYDFKEFMPVGRRGDEIIRRLADRLVELDLLDQAAEMLQHQIDNRISGAQRATVAARLAMIRLMNRQPAEALRALGNSRIAEMPRDVRRARQLLEAKALSDLSRTDLALDILSAETGPEVDRLRADVLWSARRWREAGEAHERILGEAWRKSEPLSERERADALRAAVAYVMSEEALAVDRLRTKFAAPMAQTPDARMFAFITGLDKARPGDIREISRAVANADTLTEFMDEYRKRYPEIATSRRGAATGPAGQPPAPEAAPAQGQPAQAPTAPNAAAPNAAAPNAQPAAAAPPQTQPQRQG